MPACIQLFAASPLPSGIWIIPGIIPACPCAGRALWRCCCAREVSMGAGPGGLCGFFSSGADAPLTVRSLWRNGRARWTSNPEVPGSSPGRDDLQVDAPLEILEPTKRVEGSSGNSRTGKKKVEFYHGNSGNK